MRKEAERPESEYSWDCELSLIHILFPMAVAGVDIRKVVQGAKDMKRLLWEMDGMENPAYRYAVIRNLLYQEGIKIEMLSFFEPRYRFFAKWWIQLFAESEGKDGKGIYPVAVSYTHLDVYKRQEIGRRGHCVWGNWN